MSADFAGLAGLSISTIGTVAITGEVARAVRSYGKQQRKSYRRSAKGRRR